MKLDGIKALVFDAYGTVFDVHSVVELAEPMYPGKGQALSELRRAKQIEYMFLRTLMGRYAPRGRQHRGRAAIDEAMFSGHDPPEFPDIEALLEALLRAEKLAARASFGSLGPVLVATRSDETRKSFCAVFFQLCRNLAVRIVAMISVESVGFYSDEPGSQRYPFPFRLLYPGIAKFIGFVANPSSRTLLRRVIATFRDYATIRSEGAAPPGWMPGVGWSDHWSFWEEGYEAIMVSHGSLPNLREAEAECGRCSGRATELVRLRRRT
jgi:hypothetical protein